MVNSFAGLMEEKGLKNELYTNTSIQVYSSLTLFFFQLTYYTAWQESTPLFHGQIFLIPECLVGFDEIFALFIKCRQKYFDIKLIPNGTFCVSVNDSFIQPLKIY